MPSIYLKTGFVRFCGNEGLVVEPPRVVELVILLSKLEVVLLEICSVVKYEKFGTRLEAERYDREDYEKDRKRRNSLQHITQYRLE